RNVVAGNLQEGILVYGAGTDSNVVAGNYVGVNAAGTAVLSNALVGVYVVAGARGNRVGTDGNGVADAAERNVISGNLWDGVFIGDPGTDGNLVAGNFIGVDVTGAAALGDNYGVRIDNGAKANRVGTDGNGVADPAERNVISGNRYDGV